MEILLIAILIAFLLDTITDWYYIEILKKAISYRRTAILVFLWIVGAIVLDLSRYASYGAGAPLYGIPIEILLYRVSLIVTIPSIRWIFHDYFLNLFRGKDRDYLGKGESSAYTDRFLRRIEERYSLPYSVTRALALWVSIVLAWFIILIAEILI